MLYDTRHDTKLDLIGLVFLDAADRIERKGMCRKRLRNDLGQICVDQAIIEAAEERVGRPEWPKIVGQAICVFDNYLGMPSADWNDDVCKNVAQAAAELRNAAWSRARSD